MKTLKTQPQTSKSRSARLWINGRWANSKSGKTFQTLNPATGELLAEVSEADGEDVDLAAHSARKAFETGIWPSTKPSERGKILRRIADLIRGNAEELARLETLDSGKPIKNSRAIDIPAAAGAFDYYAGWADKLSGETVNADPGYFSYTLREPLGVIGAITPWNFPLLMASQKIAAALSAGNTVVLKPAEQTPLTSLKLAEISAEAGLPEGVLNVIPGFGPTAGAALAGHPEVDGISFTGEYRTGQEIMRNAATTLKRISFELGGKSAHIIFEDADLEAAAEFACDGIFFNQGEVCCSGSRLLVQESIHKDFHAALIDHAKKWQPGDPLNPKTEMGALISGEQKEKILRYIDLGCSEGATLVLDGRKHPLAQSGSGLFIGPTLFENVKNTMRIAQEEIFGPVLAKLSFKTPEEAVHQANQNIYGLAAAVWTRDIQKAHRMARSLKAGTVWINCFNAFDHAMPFGGYKMSGFGREGGIHTFDFFTQVKSVWMKI